MATKTAQAMTPKQQQVFDLLQEGVAPAEIATRLKISPSGVYGHIRNMRAQGIRVPVGDASEPTEALAPANGASRPATALQAAIDADRERVRTIDAQLATLQDERIECEAAIERYTAALRALGS
jgi:predicted ArsR family transcriptional regulator